MVLMSTGEAEAVLLCDIEASLFYSVLGEPRLYIHRLRRRVEERREKKGKNSQFDFLV